MFPFVARGSLRILTELSIRYDELVQNYKVTYVAGGAAQNAARGAAVSADFWLRSTSNRR